MDGAKEELEARSAEWKKEIARLKAAIARLRAENASLKAQLAGAMKNSATSSKPPSSDTTSPPRRKPPDGKKRRRGAQPGHERHERVPFTPEEIDNVYDYTFEACPTCGGDLQESDVPQRVLQQVEIIERPIIVDEHREHAYWCPACGEMHVARFPEELVKAGLIGPRLTALVAYLKGPCHASFSAIRKFFRDVVKVRICRGQLAKLIQKVSASLEQTYEQLLDALPSEAVLNVDETGHKDQGERFWTWCFRAALYTVFRIDKSRGSKVLIDVLGKEFDGLIGCDYFSAYRKFMKDFDVPLQFCLAHLIRDVKFLVEHPNKANRIYGERLLGHLRNLFRTIHRRDEFASEKSFQKALATIRNSLVAEAILYEPGTREAINLANRFVDHAESYFRFITTPGIDPTNNVAEQAIRFVAIHRRITQGTRGEQGQRWCERMWTVVTTCAQQSRSVFDFMCAAVVAHFQGKPAPTLIPDTS